MSRATLYSEREINLWSGALACLTFLALLIGMLDFLANYFPGQEDASLIVESSSFKWDYWFKSGYFEWFNLHPQEQVVKDYEIRPLTNLMTWGIYQLMGERWWAYPLFNIILAVALVFYTSRFVFSFGRHPALAVMAIVLLIILNPANSIEFLIDHSFYQVLLCSLLFLVMYEQWVQGRWVIAALICVLCVVLKESAWFYPGVFVLLGALYSHENKKLPPWRMLAAITMAVFVSATCFLLMHPSKLLSFDVAVFSIDLYDSGVLSTIFNGLLLLPHYVSGMWAIVLSVACWAAMGFEFKNNPKSRTLICFLIPALVAGWLFHEELRWTHELTFMWMGLILGMRSRLWVALLATTAVGWTLSSAPRLDREYEETRVYGFYAKDYRKPFVTALELMKAAKAKGLNTVLVVNDPLRMNGDYFSVIAGADANWVSLNSIDYPFDSSAPNEIPLWVGSSFVVKNAGEFSFMGFKGIGQSGWMDSKHYGGDARVIDVFLPSTKPPRPEGNVRFFRQSGASVIAHTGPLASGVAYAYFWRDSKDAWLFYESASGAREVELVSPYAKRHGDGYEVVVDLGDCKGLTVEIDTHKAGQVRQEGCFIRGQLLENQHLSVRILKKDTLMWAYLMRIPAKRVILDLNQRTN